LRIAVGGGDLTDRTLKRLTQLGVDCVDVAVAETTPGMAENGSPDLDELLKITKRIKSWGLGLNRCSLPAVTERFLTDQEGGEEEVERAVEALRVYAEAGFPIIRPVLMGDQFNHLAKFTESVHRGGYKTRGLSMTQPAGHDLTDEKAFRFSWWPRVMGTEHPSPEQLADWWAHFCRLYERLVPEAEERGVKLAMHPSDIPLPDTPFGSLGYHRIIDAFPSRSVGYLYCCGTRAEAGGMPLLLDEIHNYGRKGRIFMVHLRNPRGTFPITGAFEEALLDDGYGDMFTILKALEDVGFDGCVNPDHYYPIEGDSATDKEQSLAYAVGHLKGLLAALDVV
jgi:mannonate dehydratase